MADGVPKLRALTPRQWCGWLLLFVSCVAWLVVPVVPFLPIDLAEKATWTAGLIIFAEITGWSAMPLLGPEIVSVLKRSWDGTKSWIKNLFGIGSRS